MSLLNNKLVILVLAGLVLAGVVWYSFMRDDSTALLQTTDLTEVGSADSDVVRVLLQLRAVSLSGTIFTDPAFQSLQDFGREITPEPVGRSNPFAPIGGMVATSTQNTQPASAPRPTPAR